MRGASEGGVGEYIHGKKPEFELRGIGSAFVVTAITRRKSGLSNLIVAAKLIKIL